MQRATNSLILASLCVIAVAPTDPARAATIGSRAMLDLLLGGQAVTEDFETFNMGMLGGISSGIVGGGTVFDSSKQFPTSTPQGPGLVVDGVSFDWGTTTVQWIKGGFFIGGEPPTQMLFGVGSSGVNIDFATPMLAFGLDLYTVIATGGGTSDYNVQVFAGDDSTLLANDDVMSSHQHPFFYGFENAGNGIGRVFISVDHDFGSDQPYFDDLTFGQAAIPEPTSLALLGITAAGYRGLRLRRRRKDEQAV